jgi:protein TonB
MNPARPLLGQALALSIALHAALIFLSMHIDAPQRRPARPDLTVRLPEPPPVPATPAAPEPPPRLQLPPEPQQNASAVPPGTLRARREAPGPVAPPPAPPADAPRLTGEAALRAAEQLARELPYPPEAIERGLQGEALVLLFLDRAGNVIAARLEASSGHALLDDAALRAARQLRSLPDSAPREALLPVRFRLR